MDHLAIIERLGGYWQVAGDLGLHPTVVWRWGRTRSIPVRRWPWVVNACKAARVRGVSLESLATADQIAREGRAAQREAEAKARRARRGRGRPSRDALKAAA